MTSAKSNRLLFVIAHNNFRDEEYLSARKALESKGAQITVASTVKDNAAGSQGMYVNADALIDEINPDEFDGVVFIGGTGSSQYWHDVKAHDIAKALFEKGKLVAASSHASVTLAVAGLLKSKKATGHITIYEKLQVAGAEYTGRKLEIDGNILTCTGANAAKEFGQALADKLN